MLFSASLEHMSATLLQYTGQDVPPGRLPKQRRRQAEGAGRSRQRAHQAEFAAFDGDAAPMVS